MGMHPLCSTMFKIKPRNRFFWCLMAHFLAFLDTREKIVRRVLNEINKLFIILF